MNRNDLIFVGLGGGGSRLVDTIMTVEPIFQGYFINTSITDIKSLENHNDDIKNYFCISTNNGVGRNRELGKSFAKQSGYAILDMIEKFNQDVVYLVASMGGGSGSAILSELLQAIDKIKDDDFNKIINVIAIIPDLNSPTVILENAKNTWNEIIQYECINNIMFINNNCKLEEESLAGNEKELRINEIFAETFTSFFDIPLINGIQFDNANLSNILKNKGCMYFYDLPNDCTSIEVAMRKAEKNSILGKMYTNNENTIHILDENKKEKTLIKCGYLGISFVNEDYNQDFIINSYQPTQETYVGKNLDRNLVLISGNLPPYNDIKIIDLELEERKKENNNNTNINFSDFVVKSEDIKETNTNKKEEDNQNKNSTNKKKTVIKKVRRDLF